MPTLPTLKVEVAFNTTDPMTASPTWTDITSYVRSGTLKRGRLNELERISAGTATLVLDSRARQFDPTYTAGPYYGKLVARKQIRISATYGATSYPLWRGFVKGWPLSPDLTGDNTCDVEAFDGLAYLGTITLPPDYYTHRVTDLSPVSWWPMGATDQSLGDQADGKEFTFTTTQPNTSAAATRWIAGAGTTFDGTFGAIGPVVNAGATAHTTVFWFRSSTAGPVGGLNPIIASAGTNPQARIGINNAGKLEYSNNPSATFGQSTIAVNDGEWHLGAIMQGGGSVKVYVDGYDRTDTGTMTSGTTDPSWALIGIGNPTTGDSPYYTGDLQHVIVFNTALTATDIAGLAVAGFFGTPYAFTRTDQFVSEILDAAGWPTGLRTLSTGTVQPGGMQWGRSALQVLQDLADTENSRIYIDASGSFVFTNRADAFTATRSATSQATFSDSGTAGTIAYSSLGGLELTDDYVANRITINTAAGASFTSSDATSISSYGVRARTVDTLLNSQADAQVLASILLTQYAQPILRVKDFTALPPRNPDVAYPKLLATELADRITWELQPQRLGTRISQQLLVEQVTHTFAPGRWATTLSCSPARVGWVLGDSTYGLLGSTTVLA